MVAARAGDGASASPGAESSERGGGAGPHTAECAPVRGRFYVYFPTVKNRGGHLEH